MSVRPSRRYETKFQRFGRGQEAHPKVGRGREAHPEVRKGSGHSPGGPEGFGTPSRKSSRGREAHPEVRETLLKVQDTLRRFGMGRDTLPEVREGSERTPEGPGDPLVGLGRVGRHTGGPVDHPGGLGYRPGCPRGFLTHSRRSGRGRNTLPEVQGYRETLLEVRGVGTPSWWSRRVWDTFRRSGRVREAHLKDRDTLPEVREGSGHPAGGPEGYGTQSRRSGRGWDTLPEVQEGLGHPPGGSGRVGTLSRRSGRGRDTLPEVREASGGTPKGPGNPPGGLGHTPGGPGGFGIHSRRFERVRNSLQ